MLEVSSCQWSKHFLPLYIFKYIYKLARFLSVKGYSVETLNGFTIKGRLWWTWVWDLSIFCNILLLITSVNSFMFLQIPFLSECFVTLGAVEWILNSVSSFMSLQIAWCWAFVVTLGAAELFFSSVSSFMSLQITWRWAFVVTLRAAKWFITSVDFLMSL